MKEGIVGHLPDIFGIHQIRVLFQKYVTHSSRRGKINGFVCRRPGIGPENILSIDCGDCDDVPITKLSKQVRRPILQAMKFDPPPSEFVEQLEPPRKWLVRSGELNVCSLSGGSPLSSVRTAGRYAGLVGVVAVLCVHFGRVPPRSLFRVLRSSRHASFTEANVRTMEIFRIVQKLPRAGIRLRRQHL